MRIALEFAELGPVEGTLSLAGDTLDLLLRCDTPDVAAKLREATPALRAAIAERALDLAHVSIADGQA
jgi:flagellar hook-length control protein FliK